MLQRDNTTKIIYIYICIYDTIWGLPSGSWVKNLQCRRCGFNSWGGKIPWRRKWQLISVFLLEESHGQRSLVGYNPWGHKIVGHDLGLTIYFPTFYKSH